ncbi:hypothetical protein [Thiohalomonas denitrificans]|uniref:hypothetical protein n=1 Tax=Thiohalomonas denitrificans TaxID=415747 RepID=UPI0026F15CFD|nr:hypothetical protein [Thiohalomonas denitrificans]
MDITAHSTRGSGLLCTVLDIANIAIPLISSIISKNSFLLNMTPSLAPGRVR